MNDLEIQGYLDTAKAITWDTCHKIYVLMDDEEVEKMREYEYDPILTSDELSPDEMFIKLMEWYDDSCSLRFIQAVETNHEYPNEGFTNLVSQGEGWYEDGVQDNE